MSQWPPSSITTDQLGSYPKAIDRLQREGKLSAATRHQTCKCRNNIIEADHGALKQVIRPTRGFQTMRTAAATIKGFEVMRLIRGGHCLTGKPRQGRGALCQQALRDFLCRSLMEHSSDDLRPNELVQQSRPSRPGERCCFGCGRSTMSSGRYSGSKCTPVRHILAALLPVGTSAHETDHIYISARNSRNLLSRCSEFIFQER